MKEVKLMEQLAKVLQEDLEINYDYAYRLIEDSFYSLYPIGGSVETYEVLEQAYENYRTTKQGKLK